MKKKLFTMVELIIVIAIIAFLAVSATIVLTKFVGNSRDTRRISDVATIKRALDVYYTENYNTYPMPDADPVNGISTGTVNGVSVSYKGVIGDAAGKNISLQRTPKDPTGNQYYVYGVKSDKREYQISYVLENGLQVSYTNGVYAAGEKARVEGNYKENMVVNITGQYYVVNVPSLIYANSGFVDLVDTNTYYVIDKKENLPYFPGTTDLTKGRAKDGNTILKEIKSNNNATLVAVNITDFYNKTKSLNQLLTGTSLDQLGGTGILVNLNNIIGTVAIQGPVALTPVNGVCGADSGQSLVTSPTNLCTFGTASAVGGIGPWTWTCNGENGGTTANCSATSIPTYSSSTTYTIGQKFIYNGALVTVQSSPSGTSGRYGVTNTKENLNCSDYDIAIWTNGGSIPYIVSACNVGTNTAGVTSSSYGRLFKWGDNNGRNNAASLTNYIPYVNGVIGTQVNTTNRNLTTQNTSTSIWETNKNTCSNGYHVPSRIEWGGIVSAGGWGTNGTYMMNALKLPLAGRHGDATEYRGQEAAQLYWSSTAKDINSSYHLIGQPTSIDTSTSAYSYRYTAMSVRCFKD